MDGGTGSLLYLWQLTGVCWLLLRWDNSYFSGISVPCRYPASCESLISLPLSPFPVACQDHSSQLWLPSAAARHHTFQLSAAWAPWFQFTQLSLRHGLYLLLRFFLPLPSHQSGDPKTTSLPLNLPEYELAFLKRLTGPFLVSYHLSTPRQAHYEQWAETTRRYIVLCLQHFSKESTNTCEQGFINFSPSGWVD